MPVQVWLLDILYLTLRGSNLLHISPHELAASLEIEIKGPLQPFNRSSTRRIDEGGSDSMIRLQSLIGQGWRLAALCAVILIHRNNSQALPNRARFLRRPFPYPIISSTSHTGSNNTLLTTKQLVAISSRPSRWPYLPQLLTNSARLLNAAQGIVLVESDLVSKPKSTITAAHRKEPQGPLRYNLLHNERKIAYAILCHGWI